MTDEQVNNPNGHEFGKEAEKYISKLPGFLQQVAWNAFLTGASIGAKKYKNAAAVNSITVGNINYTTDEQIKQNAKTYAELLTAGNKEHYRTIYTAAKEGYKTGAHSRDDEIKHITRIATIYKEDAQDTMAECKRLHDIIDKLSNPWISVKDRLPERMTSIDSNGVKIIDCCSKDVFGYDDSYKMGRLVCYNHESEMWESHDAYTIGKITHWMPVPKIQTQNKED